MCMCCLSPLPKENSLSVKCVRLEFTCVLQKICDILYTDDGSVSLLMMRKVKRAFSSTAAAAADGGGC